MMQKTLFPMIGQVGYDPLGARIVDWFPAPQELAENKQQAVITVKRDANGKRLWFVWTRHTDPETRQITYFDGLEFRHSQIRAHAEFQRRGLRLSR